MTRYVLSPRARRDIDEIWDYTAKLWGAKQAENYLRQLQAAIKLIAANPALGRSCDNVRRGYRKFPAGSHMLFDRAESLASRSSAFSTRAWMSTDIS
jgi:toxin ParE1/3/4